MVTAATKLNDTLWKESYDKPRQHIKNRDITLPRKIRIVKAKVFPVVRYRCECWTIKKTECQRIDIFEWWCWRRLLRITWTARRSNHSILKEINLEYSLEGLMLKLELQSFVLGSSPSRILGYPQERQRRRERDDTGLIMDLNLIVQGRTIRE